MISTTYTKISVQDLIMYSLQSGDISSSFTGNNRLVEGTRAHRKVQKSRPEGYQAEVSLTYTVETEELALEISGRADGIFLDGEITTIEEIKSTFASLEELNEGYMMHWAQAKCYAYIYATQHGLTSIQIQLTYYQLDDEETRSLVRFFTIEELESFFQPLIQQYLQWATTVYRWQLKRDESIKRLEFPFTVYRKGQRELAVGVYKTIVEGSKLFAQAPTGIGKTAATLFPAIKALGEGYVSKVFYLTAKTITREIAEKALDRMREKGLSVKTLTLTAKEKICFHGETNCDPEICLYACGHFDRVNVAVADIFQHDEFTRPLIEEYARKHQVCPFEFALDLSLWSDCIVCDYNYVFDPRVFLKRFFMDGGGDYGFLIDEAHNMVDRAREMFSAELEKQPFLELKRGTKGLYPKLHHWCNAINDYFIKERKRIEEGEEKCLIEQDAPGEMLYLLKEFVKEADLWFGRYQGATIFPEVLDQYFAVSNFLKVAEIYDERFVTYTERIGNEVKVKLFCLDPSAQLKEALKRGKAAIFFSATLTPLDYFKDVLGGEEGDHLFRVASPFLREHLCLLVADYVETTYRTREYTYDKVVDAIGAMIKPKMGNYLVYLPSYKYMNDVYTEFVLKYPSVRVIAQSSGMTEDEREAFLAQFTEENSETLVGFAVMGGIFGEGIDLTGDRLSGTAIVGVGLPQVCLEREIIRGYFAERNGQGFEYAYVYPGMNKVLQAAGRVIRTEDDRGVVLLIDRRFSNSQYRDLFPAEWFPAVRVRDAQAIGEAVQEFWR